MYTLEEDIEPHINEVGEIINSKYVNLIEIRDPYSNTTFKGLYNDEKWRSKLKCKCNKSIIMSFEEFKTFFTNLVICNYFDHYILTRKEFIITGRFQIFMFKP